MELAFAAFLIIVTVVAAVALAIGVPFAVGMVIYDAVAKRAPVAEKAPGTNLSIAVKRGTARAFVIGGGIFWSLAAYVEMTSGAASPGAPAVLTALIPFGATLVTLVLGWYFERFTAGALLLASLAVVSWGVIYQFSSGIWAVVAVMLVGPMLTAATLFWLARRDQESYERVMLARPELALVFDARSSLAA